MDTDIDFATLSEAKLADILAKAHSEKSRRNEANKADSTTEDTLVTAASLSLPGYAMFGASSSRQITDANAAAFVTQVREGNLPPPPTDEEQHEQFSEVWARRPLRLPSEECSDDGDEASLPDPELDSRRPTPEQPDGQEMPPRPERHGTDIDIDEDIVPGESSASSKAETNQGFGMDPAINAEDENRGSPHLLAKVDLVAPCLKAGDYLVGLTEGEEDVSSYQ